MKTNVNRLTHQIYNDIEINLHVSIKNENVPFIENIIEKFKGIENVPDDILTSGVYLKNAGINEYNLMSETEKEVEVKIKNLRFDNL